MNKNFKSFISPSLDSKASFIFENGMRDEGSVQGAIKKCPKM